MFVWVILNDGHPPGSTTRNFSKLNLMHLSPRRLMIFVHHVCKNKKFTYSQTSYSFPFNQALTFFLNSFVFHNATAASSWESARQQLRLSHGKWWFCFPNRLDLELPPSVLPMQHAPFLPAWSIPGSSSKWSPGTLP